MSYFIYQNKKIFYEVVGKGKPIIMLHGNTASSRMFEMLLTLYQDRFQVILMDFLGNGRSERIPSFPADLWIAQAGQVVALIELLKLEKVNILGTSGGAWTAINVGLMRPDLVDKIIADSFDGRKLDDNFIIKLLAERRYAKNDHEAKQFYIWCQGDDWEMVVDLDTKALVECANRQIPLFLKSLADLKPSILFTGSYEDKMCRKDMMKEYEAMKKWVRNGCIHMFKHGNHPAVLSNAEEYADIADAFINDMM